MKSINLLLANVLVRCGMFSHYLATRQTCYFKPKSSVVTYTGYKGKIKLLKSLIILIFRYFIGKKKKKILRCSIFLSLWTFLVALLCIFYLEGACIVYILHSNYFMLEFESERCTLKLDNKMCTTPADKKKVTYTTKTLDYSGSQYKIVIRFVIGSKSF